MSGVLPTLNGLLPTPLATQNNTFDDGSGNAKIAGNVSINGGYSVTPDVEFMPSGGAVTLSAMENFVQLEGNGTLPTTFIAGRKALFLAASSAVTLSVGASGNFIYFPPNFNTSNTSITLPPYQSIVLFDRGGGEWDVIGGSFMNANMPFQITPESALTYYPLQTLVGDICNVKAFGAIGNGSTNELSSITSFNGQNTTGWTLAQWQAVYPAATALTNYIDRLAIQAALNTGRDVYLPAGNYVCDATLTFPVSGGSAMFGPGGQTASISWAAGSGGVNGISIAGSSLSALAYGARLARLQLNGAATMLTITNATFCEISDVVIDGLYNSVTMENGIAIGSGCQTIILRNVSVDWFTGIGLAWQGPNSNTGRSDILQITNVTINGEEIGSSSAPNTGFLWQGQAATLVGTGLRILNTTNAFVVNNPGGNTTYVPRLADLHDLEIQSVGEIAMTIACGSEFTFSDSYITNGGNQGTYAVSVTMDPNAGTYGVQFTNCEIGNCAQHGLYFDADTLQMSNVMFFGVGQASGGSTTTGAYASVYLDSTASGVLISNLTANRQPNAANVAYAVEVASGATGVAIANVDGRNMLTTTVVQNNAASGQVQTVNLIS